MFVTLGQVCWTKADGPEKVTVQFARRFAAVFVFAVRTRSGLVLFDHFFNEGGRLDALSIGNIEKPSFCLWTNV